MRALFVTGTDTNVGKSVITGLLARHLLEKGYSVVTQKWVQTGSKGRSTDIDTHLKFMAKGRSDFRDYLQSMAPYIFKLAASPHLASAAEKKIIRIGEIKRCLEDLSANFDRVIVEGSGGLLVPLDRERLLIDAVKEMRLPVLLVAANRLGAINSTLLSIEALRSRGIKIVGVIFNNIVKGEERLILKDNPVAVKTFGGVHVLGTLPSSKDMRTLRKAFAPIAAKMSGKI